MHHENEERTSDTFSVCICMVSGPDARRDTFLTVYEPSTDRRTVYDALWGPGVSKE